MKLKNKILTVILLTSALFVGIMYFEQLRHPFFIFVPIVILTSAITQFLMHALTSRRITRLNNQAKHIISSELFSQRIPVTGHDEISSVAIKMNDMLTLIETTREQLSHITEKYTEGLNAINTKLQLEISERKAAQHKINNSNEEHITKLAQYDTLTCLPNRVLFNEALNKLLSHSKRHNKICAVLIINLDNFKNINIEHGNSVGDRVLQEISKRFTTTLRSEDILARLDGDEFIVLLNDIDKPKLASAVAEKLLKICTQPMKIDGNAITVTASIGICIYPNDGQSLEELLTNVDNALFKVKQSGGNGYQFYTHEIDKEAREYIQLETALRNAITNNELVLYYQPKLHIKRGNISGVEALLRWVHPELGLISPAKFIPVAEEAGLITQIGEWVLREACKMNKQWQDEGYEHFSIAVNLSPKQFNHPKIAELISTILTETGLNPQYLEIEVTETTVMNTIQDSTVTMEKIKATGVNISIDHFGTGYTSISHLKQCPITSLKIDQNFIKGIPNNPNDSAITSGIIALAHNLGIEVVAEGVETAEQVQYLSIQQCDMVQGYYLSHPLPAQKIVLQFKKLMDEVLI